MCIWVLTLSLIKLTLQDLNGDDCDQKSSLIYVKDPESFIRKVIEKRKVVTPFASIGWDGGQVIADELMMKQIITITHISEYI